MTIVAYSGTIDRPLMTIGDAIASFMTIPDSTTKNMCLTSREEIVKRHREYRRWKTHNPGRPRSEYPDYPDIWKADEAQRWQYSTSTWANAASSGKVDVGYNFLPCLHGRDYWLAWAGHWLLPRRQVSFIAGCTGLWSP